MTKIFDIAIIGTGSVGSAAGYYASLAGQSVLELDSQRPPHREGSHHGETRIIRFAYGEGAKYLPLLLRAKELWLDLQKKSGQQIFKEVGVLNVGPKSSPFIKNVQQTAETYDLNVAEYPGSAIADHWPNLHFDDQYLGIYEKEAGYLYSEKAIKSYLALAADQGVVQDFSASVSQVNFLPDGLVEISNQKQRYLARQVILTTGSWVQRLFPDLPIQVERKVFSWFKVGDDHLDESTGFPAFTIESQADGNTYYGFPAHDGQIKIGKHNGGQFIQAPTERSAFGALAADGHEIDGLLAHHLSGTAGLDHGAACTYDLSPDQDFIIDHLPNHPQVHLVTGLSGHGFKFASVLGKILVDRADHHDSGLDLTPFSLTRFQ